MRIQLQIQDKLTIDLTSALYIINYSIELFNDIVLTRAFSQKHMVVGMERYRTVEIIYSSLFEVCLKTDESGIKPCGVVV